jgi:hypothetical protein
MKKLLIILLVFTSCKKDSEPAVQIQVKDAITNTPVKGATVDLLKCQDIDIFCVFGYVSFRSSVTGNDGSCSFTQKDYDKAKATGASKADYWGIGNTKTTTPLIFPEGWMRLRIIRGTNYPSQSLLKISIQNVSAIAISSTECNTAADSIILVRGFGGQLNNIDWQVVNAGGMSLNSGTWQQQIPRLDTIKNITLNY